MALLGLRCAGDVSSTAFSQADSISSDAANAAAQSPDLEANIEPSIGVGSMVGSGANSSGQDPDSQDPTGQDASKPGPAAGPAECADRFRTAEGACEPKVDECPPGTWPHVRTGCQPAGISPCPLEFTGADGACVPRVALCPPNTIPVPTRGCLPIAPERSYVEPRGQRLYVRAAVRRAATGGRQDGSRARPFSTIAAANAAATPGVTIDVGPGTWRENVRLRGEVTLMGAGAAITMIAPMDGHAIVVERGGDASVAKLAVRSAKDGIQAHHASLRLDGVHVVAAGGYGVWAHGSELRISRCLVEHTGAAGITNTQVSAVHPVTTTVQASAFVDTGGRGLEVLNGWASVSDVHVEAPRMIPTMGFGAIAVGSWDRHLSATINAVSAVGGPITSSNVDLTLSDSVVVDAPAMAASNVARAIELTNTTVGYVSRCLVLRPEGTGIYAAVGSTAQLSGNVVVSAWSADHPNHEVGGIMAQSSQVTSEDDTVIGCAGHGAAADDPSARLDASGLFVWGTTVRAELKSGEHFGGYGLHVGRTARATLTDSAIVASANAGVWVGKPGTEVSLTRTLVADGTGLPNDGGMGVGASIQLGAKAHIDGSHFRGNRGAAIWMQQSALTVTRTAVQGTRFGTIVEWTGHRTEGAADGVLAVRPTHLEITGVRVEGCERAGVLLSNTVGRLDSSSVRGCSYGLVLEGTNGDVLGPGNTFVGNREKDVWTDGSLIVPTGSAPLPP